jgi:SAM-dependent methyltransferase
MYKYIFPICAILSTSIFSAHAMDTAPLFDKEKDGFSAFRGLTPQQYIEKCMPALTQSEQEKARKTFLKLVSEGDTPILEGTKDSVDNLAKVLPEGGHSIPPIMEIQGPLLLNCAQKPLKHVLNIGPGSGNDDIMILCTNNVQVISADIYQDQLTQLKQRVENNLGVVPKEKFFAYIKNYADEKTVLLETHKNGFEIVNENKMLHFLTGEETKTCLKNTHTLLKNKGKLYLTVMTPEPNSDDDQYFKKKKALGVDCPGLIYYDIINYLGTQKLPELKILPNGAPELPSPGHKIEYYDKISKKHTLRQGRHYHDMETLTPYLDPYFHILDSTVVNYGAAYFLSVIAEKK